MTGAAYRGWGLAFAFAGVLAFSFRPILIKLSYAAHPVSPTTLLFLRMALAAPFFLAVAWWLRGQQPRLEARDWAGIVALGFLDRRPLFPGHVLVVPREHHVTLADLPVELVGPYFERVQRVADAVPVATAAKGSFVAINNLVSQSVLHLHAHVVPRTKGDGLRGFFWPRTKYLDDAHAVEVAARVMLA